jgi:hypothetical protein
MLASFEFGMETGIACDDIRRYDLLNAKKQIETPK